MWLSYDKTMINHHEDDLSLSYRMITIGKSCQITVKAIKYKENLSQA